MKKNLIILTLLTAGLCSCAQISKSTPDRIAIESEPVDTIFVKGQNIDTESNYTDSEGKVVTIQNSFPRGGIRYTDPDGNDFVYAIFWSRVINKTDSPIELSINFPSDSFPSPASYLKVFLSSDTMTIDQISSFNYGIKDLEAFLDTDFHKPTLLQRLIKPKEDFFFCTVAISSKPYNGAVRAGFILKEEHLFYKINILDDALIPCGQIVFKN